ncbi:MAG: hypothetical protein WD772_04075 [Pseudohongiellaceae bacterium]
MMLRIPVLLVAVLLGACLYSSSRDYVGQPLDWSFIQAVGGIRLGEPYNQNGLVFVPIVADVSGRQTITTVPSLTTENLICRIVPWGGTGSILKPMTGNQFITVYTQERSAATDRLGETSQCPAYPLMPFNPILYSVVRRIDLYYVDQAPGFLYSPDVTAHLIGSIDLW